MSREHETALPPLVPVLKRVFFREIRRGWMGRHLCTPNTPQCAIDPFPWYCYGGRAGRVLRGREPIESTAPSQGCGKRSSAETKVWGLVPIREGDEKGRSLRIT